MITQITQYCRDLFYDKYYCQFGIGFVSRLVAELTVDGDDTLLGVRRKIAHIVSRIVSFRLKKDDQYLLDSLLQTFKFDPDQRNKTKKPQGMNFIASSKIIAPQTRMKNLDDYDDDSFVKNAHSLLDSMAYSWETGKNVVVVGPSFCGKSLLINKVKEHFEEMDKCKINLSKVYFMAHQDKQLLSNSEKGPGIIAKCLKQNKESWVILDGPLNDKYLNLFGRTSKQLILSNYGVVKTNNPFKQLKFILKTTSLGNLSPDFLNSHSIVYLEENQSCIQNLIRSRLNNFVYKDHEEETRTETKGDDNTQLELKSLKVKLRPVRLPKELLDGLITQLIGFVDKLAPKGSLKMKSVEFLYEISKPELANKVCSLVQCIFIENWDTINEKVSKKTIEKFACWAVLWSLSTVVAPEDCQKLQKTATQITKSPIFQGLLKSIVFPGSGLDIYSINSTRVQNSLSPNCGQISNIINKYNSLFESESNSSKNKFENEFHFDEPHRIRVITEESAFYSYFAMLNRHYNIPIAIYGPAGSGKKCIIDVFNKKNKENVDTYSVRFKRFDPYFIAKQIQKPFNKIQVTNKLVFRPFDTSKRINVSVDDVAMTTNNQPATQFLRMLANENSLYDDKYNLVEFRQMMLTITVNQIQLNNFEGVDFTRVLSRFFLLQTANKDRQKLYSMFTPILQNLCFEFLFNGNSEKAQSFINKNRENIVINSTVNTYLFIQEMAVQSPVSTTADLNRKLLLAPKMQEISSCIANLCQIQDSQTNDMQYFAEFWAYQAIRVFGDKLVTQQQKEAFFDEIKKTCFIQFKQNLTNLTKTSIFTNLTYSKEENEGVKLPFIKYQNILDLQREIEEVYCKETGLDCLPMIAEEFTTDLMKIYRVLRMVGGNLLICTPLKKSVKCLLKIVSVLTKGDIYHDLESGKLDFDVHLSPSILKDINCTTVFDIDTASQELIYMMTCIANRNIYDFEISPETRDKIRGKFIAIAQESWTKDQPDLKNSTKLGRTFSMCENADALRFLEIQNRIQIDFMQIVTDCIPDYLHIVTIIEPHKPKATKIINENMSLIKNMQVCWFNEYSKDMTLTRTTERMIQISEGSIQCSKLFIEKCYQVYQLLSDEQKGAAHFSKFCENCYRTYENLNLRVNSEIRMFEECLQVINQNVAEADVRRQNSKKLQDKMEVIAKNQEQLSLNIKKLQESGSDEGIEAQELEMKKIKYEKENLDLLCREARNAEKMSQTLTDLLPNKEQIEKKLKKAIQINKKSQYSCIVVQAAITFLNNAGVTAYLQEINAWASVVGLQNLKSVRDVISLFENVYGPEALSVPGWHKFSAFTQLKGFHFVENFKAMPESVFGMQPIVVDDKEETFVKMLSSILSYYNTKLICHISSGKQSNKREEPEKVIRKQMMITIEKELIKAIGEQKEDCRNEDKVEFRNGVILVGENYKWQPNRNDIDLLEKKVLKERKFIINNHIVIRGTTSPNITFGSDTEDLKYLLIEKSIQTEFGDSKLGEINRVETLLVEIAIIEEEKRNALIEKSTEKEPEDLMIQNMEVIENQLAEVLKNKKKMTNYLADNKKNVNDLFLIEWLLTFADNSPAWTYSRVIEIYEFLKKCMMELNSSREDKIDNMEKVEPAVIANWTNLIKANLNSCNEMSLDQFVNLCMPLEETTNLILLQGEGQIEENLPKLLVNCTYNVQSINMLMSSLSSSSENSPPEENRKNLLIFNKMGSSSTHVSSLMEYLQKNKGNCCPAAIIVSSECEQLEKNPILLQNFRIINKTIPLPAPKFYEQINQLQDLKQLKTAQKETSKIYKKSPMEEEEGMETTQVQYMLTDHGNEESLKIRQNLKKFFVILFGAYLSRDNPSLAIDVPLKAIGLRVKLVRSFDETKKLLKDFMQGWSQFSDKLLDILFFSQSKKDFQTWKPQQIQTIYTCYSQLLQKKSNQQLTSNKPTPPQKKKDALKIQKIEDMINMLPFSFNVHDFKESNQPIVMWLVEQANMLNYKKFVIKRCLQDCLDSLKGNHPNCWTNQVNYGSMFSDEYISKLCVDFKTIKKALEQLNIIGGMDMSLKDIRIANPPPPGQAQPIIAIASQSIDLRDYENFSKKLIVLLMIKAAKKLKLPLSKLKITWRQINIETMIQEQVSGQNCFAVNATISDPSLSTTKSYTKQQNSMKLLLMVHDPTQTGIANQPLSKQTKKEKPKKKQEQIKSINTEIQGTIMEIAVKQRNGDYIGVLKMTVKDKEQFMKLKEQIKEPCFRLF